MSDDKLTVEDMIKAFFIENPGPIHYSDLAVRLRALYPDAPQQFVESYVIQVLNQRLAKEKWLTHCGPGKFRKSP